MYISPQAGEIEAPDGYTAARWLMHRLTHQVYGDRAIVRSFQAWPLEYDADHWTADAWLGAPAPGDGRLELWGIQVYELDAYLLQSAY